MSAGVGAFGSYGCGGGDFFCAGGFENERKRKWKGFSRIFFLFPFAWDVGSFYRSRMGKKGGKSC